MALRRWIALVVTLASLGACGSAGPTISPTASPGASPTRPAVATGRILFERQDPDHGIFEMDADGSNVAALPGGPLDFQPAWSPDHRSIAFVRGDPAEDAGLYVMDADGSNARLVVHDPAWGEAFPTWSPDGTQLAYAGVQASGGIGVGRLYVVNVDGTGRHVVTDTLAGSVRVDWSPDGAWILFFESSGCDLCAIRPDGTGAHRIASLPADSSAGFGFGTWSPDGTRIAFERNQSIVTVSPDGTGMTPLTTGAAMDGYPDWSPDGNWIAFERFVEGANSELWEMRADGSDAFRVSDPAFSDGYPSWQ